MKDTLQHYSLYVNIYKQISLTLLQLSTHSVDASKLLQPFTEVYLIQHISFYISNLTILNFFIMSFTTSNSDFNSKNPIITIIQSYFERNIDFSIKIEWITEMSINKNVANLEDKEKEVICFNILFVLCYCHVKGVFNPFLVNYSFDNSTILLSNFGNSVKGSKPSYEALKEDLAEFRTLLSHYFNGISPEVFSRSHLENELDQYKNELDQYRNKLDQQIETYYRQFLQQFLQGHNYKFPKNRFSGELMLMY